MSSINFFHRKLPIFGEPEYVVLSDGEYQFWWIACPKDGMPYGYTMRTRKGRPLQERLDEFIRKDSAFFGYRMIWASYVRPATEAEIDNWMQGHQWFLKKAA